MMPLINLHVNIQPNYYYYLSKERRRALTSPKKYLFVYFQLNQEII